MQRRRAPRVRVRQLSADDAMGTCTVRGWRLLLPERDEDGLGYTFVERRDRVPQGVFVKRIMEGADHRRVAAAEHPGDAPAAPPIGPGRRQFDQYLVALHGAVHLVGRDKDVVIAAGLPALRPHEPKAVTVHIQTAGNQVVARGCLGQGPVITVWFDQFAARGHAVELFEQHAAFAAPTQPQFANQLLVAGALAGRTFDAVEKFAVSHSRCSFADRRPCSLLILMGQGLSIPESFGMGDFNFAVSVVKMQRRARIARLARVSAGQAKCQANKQLRLICP